MVLQWQSQCLEWPFVKRSSMHGIHALPPANSTWFTSRGSHFDSCLCGAAVLLLYRNALYCICLSENQNNELRSTYLYSDPLGTKQEKWFSTCGVRRIMSFLPVPTAILMEREIPILNWGGLYLFPIAYLLNHLVCLHGSMESIIFKRDICFKYVGKV